MKKLLLILTSSLLAMTLSAGATSAIGLQMQAERLWHAGEYVEAMDSATRVLTIMPNNSAAKNFLHDHWDDMLRHANSLLEHNADETDLSQSLRRLELFRLMAEIADHLREVQLPLQGTNWQWYPEMYYSQGDYDSERMHVYRLLLAAADECLRSYDTDGARQHLLTALRYLLPGNERETNRADLQAAIIRNTTRLSGTNSIPEAIFAYELTNLSDALRADSPSKEDGTPQSLPQIDSIRPHLQQHVADLYNAKADERLQAGDSIAAAEFRALANDWLTPVEPDPDK